MNDSIESTPIVPANPTPGLHPCPPITPFGVWTWTTPIIPQFYYNVYSQEQRIKQICLEIGHIEAYLNYAVPYANMAHAKLSKRLDDLEAKLTAEVARLDKLIADETTNRVNADNDLRQRIDTEIANREEADETLQGNIDKLDTDLRALIAAETEAREQADRTLQANINAEAEAREQADRTLQDNIDTEAEAREQADNKLTTDLAAEANTRDESDKRIQDSIDTEIANRKNADNALGERIDNEATARASGDAMLGERIDNEATARTDADTALGNRIDALTTQVNIRPRATNIKAGDGIRVETTEDTANGDNTVVTVSSTVSADIDALNAKIETETDAREQADTALGARIDSEITDRTNADTEIRNAVKAKMGTAVTAPLSGDGDTATPLKLDYDDTDFTVSDGVLHVNGDTYMPGTDVQEAIRTAVEAEASEREAADSALSERIDGIATTVVTDKTLTGKGTAQQPLGVYTDRSTTVPDLDAAPMAYLSKITERGSESVRLGIPVSAGETNGVVHGNVSDAPVAGYGKGDVVYVETDGGMTVGYDPADIETGNNVLALKYSRQGNGKNVEIAPARSTNANGDGWDGRVILFDENDFTRELNENQAPVVHLASPGIIEKDYTVSDLSVAVGSRINTPISDTTGEWFAAVLKVNGTVPITALSVDVVLNEVGGSSMYNLVIENRGSSSVTLDTNTVFQLYGIRKQG